MSNEDLLLVNAYLDGKIDQWYFQTDGKGVVFIVNASTTEEAKAILENWTDYRPRFRKVMPVEYKRALEEMARMRMGVAAE